MNPIVTHPDALRARPNLLRGALGAAVAALALAFAAAPAAHAQSCAGDLDRDGAVGNRDLVRVLDAWGKCGGCEADLNDDGAVDGADLALLMESWGECTVVGDPLDGYREYEDGTVTFDGKKFGSWAEFTANTDPSVWRCGTRFMPPRDGGANPGPAGDGGVAASSADCDFNTTVPRAEYQPDQPGATTFCIPVVVHVIRDNAGIQGDIPVSRIISQIDVLNDRFAAARIRFYLATVDPTGAPTLGIRFYNNTAWYLEQSAYWTATAWDTSRYLNIYTNTASGRLGYARFPWPSAESSGPGDPRDRVVIRSENFGVNPAAAPYDKGLTCVHEVGHYLGLWHTFDYNEDLDGNGLADPWPPTTTTGCGAGCCYSSGDLCCDTNREAAPNSGCSQPATCNDGPDPVQNYMDYSDDACMTHFTREQIGRMRCTLMTRRAALPGPCVIPGDLNGSGSVDAADLAILLGLWGSCQPGAPCPADLNGDGIVNAADLTGLINAWPTSSLPPRTVPSWATLIEAEPNPAVVTNATLRNAIIATGLAWRVRDNASQIEMLLVPPGTFNMGCSASNQYGCSSAENPVHAVTLTCPFYIGRYEVTQAQWTATMGSNPSFFVAANGYPGSNDRPVETVSWNTIQGFLSATGLRLPTEAEWEYAYRAGTTTAFHSMPGFPNGTNDDTQVGNIAWFSSNSASQTRPVGGKAANALGLHDMSGNVWEWVNDWYSGTYYASSPSTNPPGPATGAGRVLRGGSWSDVTFTLRSSYRFSLTPGITYGFGGFRVARAP
jgi:formylglycine-generating enzyme required for sulfatase activity